MDPVTHGLFGAVAAQLGFRQRIGRDATWAMVAGAVIPDLDILLAPFVTMTGVEVQEVAFMTSHRGITHSVLVIPFAAAMVAGLWWWFRRKTYAGVSVDASANGTSSGGVRVGFLWMLLAVWLAMMSHTALDVCTAYGTQLLSPISHERFAIDVIPVIDVIFASILLATLIACAVARKASKVPLRTTRIVGWCGFMLAMGYLALGGVFQRVAIERMDWAWRQMASTDAVKAGGTCQYRATPPAGTIFVWRVTRHDSNGWAVMKVNVLKEPTTSPVIRFAADQDNEWVRQANALDDVRVFRWFAMGQVRTSYAFRHGVHVVEFHDMRYAVLPADVDSLWYVRAMRDERGGPWLVEMVHSHRDERLKGLATQWWKDLWTE